MKLVDCPHCNSHRIFTASVPSDAVAIVQCPACTELAVFFRDKAIALNRKILEEGTADEQKNHLAHVIGEFLEPGMFKFSSRRDNALGRLRLNSLIRLNSLSEINLHNEQDSDGITDAEMDRFTRFQLERLDDTDYFNRHFSN